MVNMAGYLQLAYLAMLIVSSAGEIVATQLVRNVQKNAIHYGDVRMVRDNDFWNEAVIRAALEVEERWSLADLPWLGFGLFPAYKVFANMCEVLPRLRDQSVAYSETEIMRDISDGVEDKHTPLARRVTSEVMAARRVSGGGVRHTPNKGA